MERKVMKQGPSTLVVSLPSQWVKKHNVKKGHPLFIQEKGKELNIRLKPQNSDNSISLNVSNTQPMTNRITGSLYKAGYDEIRLTYKTADEAQEILKAVNTMTGHTVIQHSNNIITIKRIATVDDESFSTIYRKCFHVLNDMANDTLNALQNNDKELMNSVIVKDTTMAVFADYARRMLLSNYVKENTAELYYIVEQIEKTADKYKALCKIHQTINATESTISLLRKINNLIKIFEELFYNFSLTKIQHFGEERKKIQEILKNQIEKANKKEFLSLVEISNILELMFDLNGPVMTINFKGQ